MKAIFKREFKSYFHRISGMVTIGIIILLALITYFFSSVFASDNAIVQVLVKSLLFVGVIATVILSEIYTGDNMSGYIFVGAMLLCMSALVTLYCFFYGMPSISYALSDMTLITALIIPAIASQAISSERKRGTERLLSMLPISRADIVLGKYFALLCAFIIPTAVFGLFPLLLDMIGEVNFGTSYAALLCYALFGAALIAISVFCSALFDKVWLGTLVNYGALLVVFGLNTAVRAFLPMGRVRDILLSLTFFGSFDGFVHGIVDIGTLIFYALVAAIFLSLGVYATEKRRLF